MKSLYQDLANKKILILGFGLEGRSTYRFLRKLLPGTNLYIADRNQLDSSDTLFDGDDRIKLQWGDHYLDGLSGYDLIVKTPGISFLSLGEVNRRRFTSHTELFMKMFGKQIIGITGTKGKSTTTGLIAHIVSMHTENVVLVGNIGIPPLDMIDRINHDTIIVYELSSHQLEQISCSPHVGVLLNLFQEHLDHYKTYRDYQLAKFNIARYQSGNDVFIYNDDDPTLRELLKSNNLSGNIRRFSFSRKQDNGCFIENGFIFHALDGKSRRMIDLSEPGLLRGDHNIMNIMAAITACAETGIPDEKIIKGIFSFKPLAHRMEFVVEVDGVKYYDDSIATIPEAAIAAAKALQPVGTIILGGYDRGVDYSGLCRFLLQSGISSFIFIDEAGARMHQQYLEMGGDAGSAFMVSTMEDAVRIARERTTAGKSCLLSPAAASYGMYLNFKERGNEFRRLIFGG